MHELDAYVRTLANLLGLTDWAFQITTGTLDSSDNLAEIAPVYGQRRASIHLSPDWQTWAAADLRSTLTHELLHCHTADIAELVEATHADALNQHARTVADRTFELALEHCVDAIAVAVARFLPLPQNWVQK